MEIQHGILHILDKQVGNSTVTLDPRSNCLPIDDRLKKLGQNILQIYSKELNSFGIFGKDKDRRTFSELLEKQISTSTEVDFVHFTKETLSLIATEMGAAQLSTGGHVVFLKYKNQAKEWLLVVMLKLKAGTGVDKNKLLIDASALDIDHLHEAARIDIQKWIDNVQPYLSFVKKKSGGEDVSLYFRRALGCTEYTDSKENTTAAMKALDAYSETQQWNADEKRLAKQSFFEYCEEKTQRKEPVNLISLSVKIDDQNPSRFYEFIRDNEYQVSENFSAHRQTYRRLQRLTSKIGNVSVAFNVDDLVSGNVIVNSTDCTITIKKCFKEICRSCENPNGVIAALMNDILQLSIDLYNNLEDREVQSRTVSGRLPSERDYDSIVQVLDESGLLQSEEKENRRIRFSLPRKNDNFFATTIEDLIENPERQVKPPARFYLAEHEVFFQYGEPSKNLPEEVNNYLRVAGLISLLNDISDYSHTKNSVLKIIFLSDKKIEIDTQYTHADILQLKDFNSLEKSFSDNESHYAQKRTIFKNSISEIFSPSISNDGSVSISLILEKMAYLCERFEHGYDLFLSDFSFEKIKNEIEKEKVEFIGRINKTFSDIQNQMLAIPASLILSGSQMKNYDGLALNNFVIWLGCILFSWFILTLVGNQRSTLSAIKREIDLQCELIKEKHQIVAHKFSGIYKELNVRYKKQAFNLSCIFWLVILVVLLTTALLLYYSYPFKNIVSVLLPLLS